ncbi:MAG: hypothetical protein ACLFS7_10445, partial [Desulfosudaceae bacterium]
GTNRHKHRCIVQKAEFLARIYLFNNIIHLHHDPAGRNHHYMQLDCAYFLIANASFFGHAKELFYSWIASKSHGGGDFYQMGRFLIQDAFVFN